MEELPIGVWVAVPDWAYIWVNAEGVAHIGDEAIVWVGDDDNLPSPTASDEANA